MALNSAAIALQAAIREDPEAGKALFVARALPPALEAVIAGCEGSGAFEKRGPQRWAVRAALQIAGWLDLKERLSVLLELCQEYGFRSETDLRAWLALASRTSSVGLEAAQARAIDLLRKVIAADPGRRDLIRAELFGAEVDPSRATVVEAKVLPESAL